MDAPIDPRTEVLETLRAYLECLTAIQVDPRLRIQPRVQARFGWSDIINATLLEAARELDQLSALEPAHRERRLRAMLANNLVDRLRRELADCRDCRLEHSLEAAVEESSCRLREWHPAVDSAPADKLAEQERSLLLASALAQLPEAEREAIILQKWHGWKLTQIAEHLHRTAGAVAGLQARGLARLRKLLPEDCLE